MSTPDYGYEHFTPADRAAFATGFIPGHTITVPPDNDDTGENFVCVATADCGPGGLDGGHWIASIHRDGGALVITGDHLPEPIRTDSAAVALAIIKEMVWQASGWAGHMLRSA